MKTRISFLLFNLLIPFISFCQDTAEKGIDERINEVFEPIAATVGGIVFYSITIAGNTIPIVLIVLIGGALFFTLYFKFPNIRYLKLAVKTVRGDFYDPSQPTENLKVSDNTRTDILDDNPDTIRDESVEGEVTPFQALTAALSATVGLGNIAGVAVALSLGGPGATFWMILAGLLGMATKFTECTLGVKYRDIDADGTVHGGPMYYLSKGLTEKGLGGLGKVFAVFFAIMCVGGSFGGGNMFQANQAAAQFIGTFGIQSSSAGFIFGVIVAFLVGIVIIGGIKRIGQVDSSYWRVYWCFNSRISKSGIFQ